MENMDTMKTIVHCNIEKNKRLIAQILDFDAEGKEFDWYEQHIELLAKQMPKHGVWEGVSPMVDTKQCSVCGYNIVSEEMETPYCPNCGSKMERNHDRGL